jgi:hypothetical protein
MGNELGVNIGFMFKQQQAFEVGIAELPLAERLKEAPERFRVTLETGGLPRWNMAYYASSFEET